MNSSLQIVHYRVKEKSSTRAYVYSIFGFLIPCWIANWALTEEADLVGPNFYVFFAIGMFALSSSGVTLGLLYLGQWKYALLAGLGRVAIVALFSIYDVVSVSGDDQAGHPYLTFIGVVLAFGWGTYDLARISIHFSANTAKKAVLKQNQANTTTNQEKQK